MQLDSKCLYVKLLRWSACMRTLIFLIPCLLTYTDCLQVESAKVRAQRGRCQKPPVRDHEECMWLELWLPSKTEVHLWATCLKFSMSYMQIDCNSQMDNFLNANSEYSVMGYLHSSSKTCQLLFHYFRSHSYCLSCLLLWRDRRPRRQKRKYGGMIQKDFFPLSSVYQNSSWELCVFCKFLLLQ